MTDCGFERAREAGVSKQLGLAPSKGIGVLAGATGLVRWTYAKADYPCSPTRKGLVKGLAEGWHMRPVRVPHAQDPCLDWSAASRTMEQRVAASRCAKACPGQGCRWVWEDVGVGETLGQGVWRPRPSSLECVAKGVADTCLSPPRTERVSPTTQQHLSSWANVCIPLPKGQSDPCMAAGMKYCRDLAAASPPQARCIRTREEPAENAPLTARCVAWNDPYSLGCHPELLSRSPCPGGSVCVAYVAVYKPMSSYPSRMALKRSVFWDNGGADVLLDMAGAVELSDNTYLSCVPSSYNSRCKAKSGFQRCLPGRDGQACLMRSGDTGIGDRSVPLPLGVSITWQNPSPYLAPELESKLSGNDVTRRVLGRALLFMPTVCQALDTQ